MAANTYIIKNSRGNTLTTIERGKRDTTSTSLVLHGRGAPEYGLERDQNLVYLLENFANNDSPSNPLDGQLWWNSAQDEMYVWEEDVEDWVLVVPPAQTQGFTIVAGAGLTGGGFPSLSPASVTLNIGEGTGITVTADAISTNDSEIVHDNLNNFDSNEHVNHGSINLTAGNGLTGGGDLTASRSFDVGAGDGITVNANDVAVDSSVVRTTGNQTIAGIKSFTSQIRADTANTPSNPAYSFQSDIDVGMYVAGGQLAFSHGSTERIHIETDGTMNVGDTANYETLVTDDDDIPNKAYVDSVAGSAGTPTSNTFTGTSTLSGLDGNQTYWVGVYGVHPNKGNGFTTLDSIRVRAGITIGSGTLLANTGSRLINWPDGEGPSYFGFIVDMSGNTSLNVTIDASPLTSANRIVAVQLTNN